MIEPLSRAFFERPTVEVARDLLGKTLVRRRDDDGGGGGGRAPLALTLARIVEVEAYLGQRDAASHARRGPTPRAAIMFGPPGRLYVYLIYGMHHCMNFVTEPDGTAGAVLIRAAEPLPGRPAAATIMRGPGKLCGALGITRAHNGLDLTARGEFYVADADPGLPPPRCAASRRIGVDYAGAWASRKLRFYVPGNPHVSGPRPPRS